MLLFNVTLSPNVSKTLEHALILFVKSNIILIFVYNILYEKDISI